MSAIAIEEIPINAAPSFMQRAFQRICDELSADAQDWAKTVKSLRRFEDEELLDNPAPEKLKWHKQTLQTLISFGEFIQGATSRPEFPNRETSEMVEATLQIMRDSLAAWHDRELTPAQAEKLLAATFPE